MSAALLVFGYALAVAWSVPALLARLTGHGISARLMREALDGGGDTEAVLSHFVAQMGGPESEVLRSVVRRLAGARRG